MALDPAVASFRDWMIREYRPDGKYESIQAVEPPELSAGTLSVRLHVGNKSYYEARVDLDAGELQAGFGTESRMVNESIEQAILDSGGDLSELLADELCDLGAEPLPMAHFFERPAFRYTVRLPLDGASALEDAPLRSRVKTVLRACEILFQECVDES